MSPIHIFEISYGHFGRSTKSIAIIPYQCSLRILMRLYFILQAAALRLSVRGSGSNFELVVIWGQILNLPCNKQIIHQNNALDVNSLTIVLKD